MDTQTISQQDQSFIPKALSEVALAYFINAKCVHDATTDLCRAGFRPEQIHITGVYPSYPPSTADPRHLQKLSDEVANPSLHSHFWSMKDSFLHDQHRQGAEQLANENSKPAEVAPPTPAINLHDKLATLGVAEETIWLIEHEVEADRIFMLVEAGHRVDEANYIMEHDCGQIRTETIKGWPASRKTPLSGYGEAEHLGAS